MQGHFASYVDGFSLLYQLIFVQAIVEKAGDLSQVPELVNNHPLLQQSALIDPTRAKTLYARLLLIYGIVDKDGKTIDSTHVNKNEDSTEEHLSNNDQEDMSENKVEEGENGEANGDEIEDKMEIDEPERPVPENDIIEDAAEVKSEDDAAVPEQKPQSEETEEPLKEEDVDVSVVPSRPSTPPLESATAAVEPHIQRGLTPPPIDTSDTENLDKLVRILYMKYTQELMKEIEGDKKEFARVLPTLKP